MTTERRSLHPRAVAQRLAALRDAYVPMTEAEACARLAEPACAETFARAVHRRLEELRALSDLSEHLHRAQPRREA